jgi:NADH-quinone oxidoreductase subunit C
MDEAVAKLASYLGDRLGEKLLASEIALGELTIEVERDSIRETIQVLRDDPLCRFGCLIDICGVDYPERD